MVIYKNDYKKNEDECLWEIHEIRNQLRKEIKNMSYDEINNKAYLLLNKLKEKYQKNVLV